MTKKNRIYVLDTSVLIHDPDCLKGFRNTSVVIPIFCVMELDDLKDNRKKFEVAASARAASRKIAELRSMGCLHDPQGVTDEENGTTYYVLSNEQGNGIEALKETGTTRHMDILILSTALAVQENHPDKETILITKDINLRILANVEGLTAEDYDRDRVPINQVFRGHRFVSEFDGTLLAEAYHPKASPIPAEDMGLTDLHPNEFIIFQNQDVTHLFRNRGGYLHVVSKEFRGVGIKPRNLEQRMALDLLLDPEVQLVTLVGKAGTGKTFLALASALAQINPRDDKSFYSRIILSKPTVAMGNSDIGFLPGGMEDKMEPWMQSFFDNLDQLIETDAKHKASGRRNWDYLLQTGVVEIQTIYTIRGRSIPQSIMFIDEAQNLTPHEIKTIITRAAEGTKVILSGDPFQCDSRFLDQHSNGITHVTERMKDQVRFGTVFIQHGVRSELSDLAATLL